MNRNPFLLLIVAFVINGFTFNLNASAGMDLVATLGREEVVRIKMDLAGQTKKNIQKWDTIFERIQIGKTTQSELFRQFKNLPRLNPLLDPSNYNIYTYHYFFTVPKYPLRHYYVGYSFRVNKSTKLVKDKSSFLSFGSRSFGPDFYDNGRR